MRERDYRLLNDPLDVSLEFNKMVNNLFNTSDIVKYDPALMSGALKWKRVSNKQRLSFNQIEIQHEDAQAWEFPDDYAHDYILPFRLEFLNDYIIRLRMSARKEIISDRDSMMINGELKVASDIEIIHHQDRVEYITPKNKVVVCYRPFNIEIYDKNNKLLTKTFNAEDTYGLLNNEPTPFSFVRRATDLKRSFAASFKLSPEEKIFGLGESFTRLNKRGQKVDLWTSDAHGALSPRMYKPIPFYLSSKGYGVFVHTSAPVTMDIGREYDEANIIYLGEDDLDLFIFTGNPKEILYEYTEITGRADLPPLWSFGLWMSRITYQSEGEVREVAKKIRKEKIPCDVIHLDTGWFEQEWRCNYEFAPSRFDDAAKMTKDLNANGFKISLWQLPYFTPQNPLYKEAIKNQYVILDENGDLPTEDAIIDFSNEKAVKWYQNLLANLFHIGVRGIKADFGEAAPYHGRYKSGKSGQFEHNLYPLRYNKAVSEITKAINNESIIWARSAWAGSQRYPIHWGGDAENTDCSMAASLRAGLSLGLCGFSFWSHDIGGFVKISPEELYRRWMPFGMLTSHSRCHGLPPKEPWYYNESFTKEFIKSVELKYSLMPYIYTQAKLSANVGYPMMRTLFFEYPEDDTAWYIEDEYLFGDNLLVAPLFNENTTERKVYLPEGTWIDYQNNKSYNGKAWYEIKAEQLPIILLVKAGSILPKAKVAQSTDDINWNEVYLEIYLDTKDEAMGTLIDYETGKVTSLEYVNRQLVCTHNRIKDSHCIIKKYKN